MYSLDAISLGGAITSSGNSNSHMKSAIMK